MIRTLLRRVEGQLAPTLRCQRRAILMQRSTVMQCRTSPSSAGPPSEKIDRKNPMEVLSSVFHHHPSALRLHRELIIALSCGDAARAADTAAVLAETVARVRGASAPAVADSAKDTTPTDDLPPLTADGVEEAMDATARALNQRNESDVQTTTHAAPAPTAAEAEELPWKSSKHLCVTLLECAFETEMKEDGPVLSEAGQRAQAEEEQSMRILQEYLDKDADRWKAQKDAIIKTVCDAAQSLGLAPVDLQTGEAPTHGSLNALKHCNLVIRGEVPDAYASQGGGAAQASEEVMKELDVLVQRMESSGVAMTEQDKKMALYELTLAKGTMRYLVGIHRDVQVALSQSDGVQQCMQQAANKEGNSQSDVAPATFFVNAIMSALHPGASDGSRTENSVAEVQRLAAITTPVLPFTFLLKCCLWFDIPQPRDGM